MELTLECAASVRRLEEAWMRVRKKKSPGGVGLRSGQGPVADAAVVCGREILRISGRRGLF
jgi:hypothetical protein